MIRVEPKDGVNIGVVIHNVVPLRAQPDSDSEQVSQALLGQPVIEEGGQQDWLYVRTWDSYSGWIPCYGIRMLEKDSRPYASYGHVAVIRELFADVRQGPGERFDVITKATVDMELEIAGETDKWIELCLPSGQTGYIRRSDAKMVDKDAEKMIWLPDPDKLVETAKRFIGVPYLWGGTSPFGIDCSGFVQLVYKINGVTLLRDAHMQSDDERCVPVEKGELRAGDFIFFGREHITHVGMSIGGGRFIHSCGSHGVIISGLDEPRYADIYLHARRLRLETLAPGGR